MVFRRPMSAWWIVAILGAPACVGEIGPLAPTGDGSVPAMDGARDAVVNRDGTVAPDTARGDVVRPEDVTADEAVTPPDDAAVPEDVTHPDTAPPPDVTVTDASPPDACVPAGAEVCNGRDDDCNGTADDGIAQQTCGMGACRRTVAGCTGGTVPVCTPAPSSAEVCGNGIDEDCDGTADDGCPSVARMLMLVNEARASARTCGTQSYPAVPPLTLDARLTRAAQLHSEDMARTNNLTHTGSDGSNAGQRITREGYTWSTWAENVARGQRTDTEVMAGWLASAGHCENIMSPDVRHLGAGVATSSAGMPFWTQVFARP